MTLCRERETACGRHSDVIVTYRVISDFVFIYALLPQPKSHCAYRYVKVITVERAVNRSHKVRQHVRQHE